MDMCNCCKQIIHYFSIGVMGELEEVCEYYTHLSVFCVVYFGSAVNVHPGHCDDTAVIGQWHCAVC